eukprot:TRINITY_DN324_c0_g1_i23.p1 TRINITY_DN324_c0_g1~~TRINITY_DN324_c0_g1_i23.p1  ORF type:complete len:203 (+),score=19.26 TRINITY_DN324_c0_g1_i23:61-669(+)
MSSRDRPRYRSRSRSRSRSRDRGSRRGHSPIRDRYEPDRRSPPRYRRSRSRSRSRSPRRSRPVRLNRGPRKILSEEEKRTTTAIYVGNLAYKTSRRGLEDAFKSFGKLRSAMVGINRRTGESKGFGFIDFEDRRDAEEAFSSMNGKDLDGRSLRLDWDLPLQTKETPRGRDRSNSRSPSPPRRPGRRSPSRSRSRSASPKRR